jgi:hypothetical protein
MLPNRPVQRSKTDRLMSELGQNQNPPLWGSCQLSPAADMALLAARQPLFDHLIG